MSINNQHRNHKLNIGHKGFSLVEVIIAIAVLALISIPLLKYFTDSMRYNARMQKQQNATMLAQEVTEELKAESRLVQWVPSAVPGVADSFGVPLLTESGGYEMTQTSVDSNFLTAGNGKIVFEKTNYATENANYDIRVTLETNKDGYASARPATFGVDNATDALAVETEQQLNEAMTYFKGIHTNYRVSHPSYPLLSDDEILANMSRKTSLSVGYDSADHSFVVKAYYTYTCTSLQGAGITDQYDSPTYLIDERMGELKNIYLLYVSMPPNDTIEVNVDPEAFNHLTRFKEVENDPASNEVKLGLYLVAQNLPMNGYTVTVQPLFGTPENTYDIGLHSNVEAPNVVNNKVGINHMPASRPLTSTYLPSSRLVSITTEVFSSGGIASGDEPLVTVTTTKGDQP